MLNDNATVKLAEIANDQDEETLKKIVGDVRKEFRRFVASTGGKEGSQPVIDAFQHAGEKLAAWYVRNGETSATAAQKAFDDLLGHKYDFVGVPGWLSGNWRSGDHYRVPKDRHPLAAKDGTAMVEKGAEWAKANLAEFDLAPKVAEAGTSPDYAMRETLRRYQREAVWVTLGGADADKGLALTYNGQVVTRRDGSPFTLTWGELGGLGRSAAMEEERRFGRYTRGGTLN